MTRLIKSTANFGTAPVFFAAISTILGAIMFLRFGYAVGSLGFLGALAIVVFGHLVTIPTAMAIAEIATNQKVEGGGEYYIISRSFGLNIGAAIGVALFLSQAISLAFYVIAFGEAFGPVFDLVNSVYDLNITDKRFVSIPALVILAILMITKGANLGVKAIYVVVGVLFLSLVLFFAGTTDYQSQLGTPDVLAKVVNGDDFFTVFAIIFPAFTGMTAGVGLSGDLKDPKKSLPIGILSAVFVGMLVYVFISYKLTISASPEDLVGDQLVMSRIAVWGPIIPIGLACATISSALGTIIVAPRTLKALAADDIFPTKPINAFLAKGSFKNNEPLNATLITVTLAMVFVSIGNVDFVAKIISMFFMVTYGAICCISFLQHFAADPSYRPAFKSRWYLSLLGTVLCVYIMFQMNPLYAIISLAVMTGIYLSYTFYRKDKQGLTQIFQGVIFQLSRRLQVFIQKAEKEDVSTWRPAIISISKYTFERLAATDLMRWISHRYGFGTYIHYINGYFSNESNRKAREELNRLIKRSGASNSNVYMDTMISPSYTTAIAQSLQLPSVSGKENNMFLFEFSKSKLDDVTEVIENIPLVKAAEFDFGVLASCEKGFGYKRDIHIWITPGDFDNASLMILLGYVILGHPEWKGGQIKIYAVFPEDEISVQQQNLLDMIKTGRLPISPHNIELILMKENVGIKEIINKNSVDADLTMVGFLEEATKQIGRQVFEGFDGIGNVLFLSAHKEKEIR